MKQIPRKKWNEYIDKLSLIDETAGRKLRAYMTAKGLPETYEATEELIRYANALVMKYGEASAALACEMYDAISMAEGANVPPAEPAPLPEYGETAKAINGTLKKSNNLDYISGAVERLVKQRGADTMIQNAKRDNAEWAWIPNGDTCSFCLTLASRGWQLASKAILRGGHAEHIHAHCDCTFAIRHDSSMNVAGYDPDKYREQYKAHNGDLNEWRKDLQQKKSVRFKTGEMDPDEYNRAVELWNKIEELPNIKNREHIVEEFDRWLTPEEKSHCIVSKEIDNYRYYAVTKGHNQYKIYKQEPVTPGIDWLDDVLTEVIGPDWRKYDI